MSEVVYYRCNNCGRRFDVEILTKEEVKKADDEMRPTKPVACPECRRTDLRPGWE